MNYLLPPLHEGHAPITLHQLFRDAMEAYDDWVDGTPVPKVYYQAVEISISDVFAHMRHCTDILPNNMVSAITERLTKPLNNGGPLDEVPFSTAARVMSVLVRKRELHSGGDVSAFIHKIGKIRPKPVEN